MRLTQGRAGRAGQELFHAKLLPWAATKRSAALRCLRIVAGHAAQAGAMTYQQLAWVLVTLLLVVALHRGEEIR